MSVLSSHRLRPRALALVAGLVLATHATIAQDPASSDSPALNREHLAAIIEAWQQGLDYVPGEVLVKFQPGLQPSQHARALSVLRGDISGPRQRWIGDLLLVHATGEADAERMAARLEQQPEVVYAQPNYLGTMKTTPNDPFFDRQWNFDLIDMRRAWDINAGGSSEVTVAVIDSGVNTVNRTFSWQLWTGNGFGTFAIPFAINPDLDANLLSAGRDFVFFSAANPVIDMVGHGTHVAGTIVQATNNSLGLAGMAYMSRLLPLKICFGYWELQVIQSDRGIPGFVPPNVSGGCPTSAGVEAVRYAADNGAKILNMSIGGPGASPAYRDVLQYAVSRGAFVAIAMGNEFEDGNPVEYPAAYATDIPGVMSVGAVGPTSQRAFYSNTGQHIEIVGPGGDSRVGGVNAMVVQAGLNDDDFDPSTVVVPRFDRYLIDAKQGTSMATPHVAGLAALLYSQGITNPAAIEAAITQFATDLGTSGHDTEFGFGLIDARATLRGLGIAR